MHPPFTLDELLDSFRRYNESVGPATWLFHVAALVVIVLAIRPTPRSGRLTLAVLAAMWLWMGVVYHLGFFRPVNGAATAFAAAFIVQGALLARVGLRGPRPMFDARAGARTGARTAIGWIVVLYALVGYPALGHALGHRFPAAPILGLPAPRPSSPSASCSGRRPGSHGASWSFRRSGR